MRRVPRVLAFAALLIGACGDGDDAPQARVTAEVDVDPSPGAAIVVDGESVWVVASSSFVDPTRNDPEHAVARIDRRSAEVLATVPVPHQMSAIAAGEGSVWATGTDFGPDDELPTGSVVRIDPDGERVETTIDLGTSSPADVAVGHGAVWVADSRGDRVVRIDPDTDRVTAEIAIDGSPSSLTVTDTAVWVNKPRTGEIRGIDPADNTPLPAIGTGPLPSIVEAGPSGLWVSDYAENDLSRVDPTGSDGVTRSVEFDSAPSRFAVGDGIIVVTESEDMRLSTVDPSEGGPSTVLTDRTIVAVAIDDGAVWAVDQSSRTVLRVELP